MTITTRRLAALAVGLLLLLPACSAVDDGGDESAATGGGGDEGASEEASDDAVAVDAAGGEAAAGAPARATVDLTAVAEGRQVISTATLLVQVEDLDAAVEEVDLVVADLDGLIYGERTDLRDGARTRLTVKVPPTRFRQALDRLGTLGEVQTQTVSTDDVTEQVVDLDSRIATAEASVDRLRSLLARAEVIRDITTIEAQLLQRETELETLRGQRRTIEAQVALATIDVTLRAERTSTTPPPPPEEPQPGFRDGLRKGAEAFRGFAVALSALAGALLPWLPLLALAAVLTRRWWRPRLTRS